MLKSINIDSLPCVQPGAEKQFLWYNPLVFVGTDQTAEKLANRFIITPIGGLVGS